MKNRSMRWWAPLAFVLTACSTQTMDDAASGATGAAPITGQAPGDVTPLCSDELCDTTQPTSVATVTPDPDPTGWHHSPVTIHITATDIGLGVESITYSFSGATTGGATVAGSTLNLTVTAEGQTTLTWYARDLAGNLEYTQTLIINLEIDDGPPSCISVQLSDYNLFLLGDYNQGHDVMGKVAAGGNISLTHFSVGAGLPASDSNAVLVAGGNLNLQHGAVFGNAHAGGTLSVDGTVSFYRGSASKGSPIDFASRGNELRSLSAQLKALTVNGQTRLEPWGGIFLKGSHPKVNVFQVNASSFSQAKLLSISAPAGSLAVVNIHGETATFTGFSTHLEGIDPHGVLYNFVNATSIQAEGFGFWGTVLAPLAHITFNNGSWDGGIYALSLTGNAEGHINPLGDHEICTPGNGGGGDPDPTPL